MLKSIKERIYKNLDLSGLEKAINTQSPVKLSKAHGSFDVFITAALFEKANKPTLVIFPTFEEAQFFKADIDQVLDKESILFSPTFSKAYDTKQVKDLTPIVERAEALDAIVNADTPFVITSADAIYEKIPSSDIFKQQSILLTQNQTIEPDKLSEQLVEMGYESVRFVDQPGEFARRGGIIDVYPFSGEYPIRVEFFGDDIDSLREFDADSQRSISFLQEARFVPNVMDNQSANLQALFSYLDENTLLYLVDPALIQANISEAYEKAYNAWDEIHNKDTDDEHLEALKAIAPDHKYLSGEKYYDVIQNFKLLFKGAHQDAKLIAKTDISFDTQPQADMNGSIKLLSENITELTSQGIETFILCDNEGQKDRFEELLGEFNNNFKYHLHIKTLHQGFVFEKAGIALYTDHQIFNRYHRPKLKKRSKAGGISFKELKDLNPGDYVVHVDYGIAKFAGFRKIEVRGIPQESVVLKYAEDSVLYVNVSSLHKIQKYSGKEGNAPKVTKLGTGEWQRKKEKTKKRVKDIARDLIKLYAKRKATQAYAFNSDNAWQTEMEARFEFEETPDQLNAILSVKEDMESATPMDRLVCGDVGFGKTEVAVRAAFKSVMDQKQVALLVPTTILADQHYKTFEKRMKDFPIRVESISRFKTAAEQKEIIKDTADGKVDILIGTHRITSKDLNFKDLGLLIIDEEQRFGVAAKERLKRFKASVDVLTLTATPIPRTLQFSLMGARDLSIISTPPPNRQPVYTEIHAFDANLIRDAIVQETSRGGQVFFIHNRVKNIEEMCEMISNLVPDIRVRFAHGQMKASQLEKIIKDFYEHKFDVLVSTNIVESGIDISNANTIIINHANHFGLAELHQLRGRVGRSARKAFCYLITPPPQSLSLDARRRLSALEEFSDLGSGFKIAMRDLDIRGAGDILGGEQSGFINDVGFDLYHKILDDAIRELKETEFKEIFGDNDFKPSFPETQVEFDLPALLEGTYVEDNVERLNLYRRLARAASLKEVMEWQEEVIDRFGPLPKSADNLIAAAQVRIMASMCRFVKITIRSGRAWLQCPANQTKDGEYFYGTDHFQRMMDQMNLIRKDKFELAQKNDLLRIVVKDIDGLDGAFDFLANLLEFDPELSNRAKQEISASVSA